MKYADLIAKLTLEEKAGLTSGRDFWHTKAVERLGIPSEMMTDGPHGLRKQESGRRAIPTRWGLAAPFRRRAFRRRARSQIPGTNRCSPTSAALSARRLWRRASAWCSGRA